MKFPGFGIELDLKEGVNMAEAYSTSTAPKGTSLIPWWLVLLEGLAALIIGIMLIANPVRTTIFLVQVLGWYWLFTGILTLVGLFMDRTDMIWKLASGILGIILGVLIIGNPMWSGIIVPASLILIAGILGLVFGCISLFWALKAGWGAALMGVLSIIFGLLLLTSPYLSLQVLVFLMAGLGIIGGIAAIFMAFKMR
jgi:uncharacterized membrane protein HdeD (DUF308 family)